MKSAVLQRWVKDKMLMIGIAIAYSFAAATFALSIISLTSGSQQVPFSRNRRDHVLEAIGLMLVDGAVIYGVILFLKVSGVYSQTQTNGREKIDGKAQSGS